MNPEVERAIERIDECLNEVYLPEGVAIWLSHRNRNLDMKTPAQLIATAHLSVLNGG